MRAPWFGLQKNASDWRCGVTASVSLIWRAGGATTRCSVERRTSLLQRASRSPAFTTMVPGWGGVCVRAAWGREGGRMVGRTYDGRGWLVLLRVRVLDLESADLCEAES